MFNIRQHARDLPSHHLYDTCPVQGGLRVRMAKTERGGVRQKLEVRKEKLAQERGENNEKSTSNQERGVIA